MSQFFDRPFASGGTRTSIPIETTSDGSMSFLEGWGYDYERDPLKDSKSRRIERANMNFLFYIITEAIGELQRQGASTWDESKIPYTEGASCYFSNTTWISTKTPNNDRPGLTGAWIDIRKSGGGTGSTFDPTKYYTKNEIDSFVQQLYDAINDINQHENGDIYPVARHTLLSNEFICNGETVPVSSNTGLALNGLPDSYKTSWGIKLIGTTLIKFPMIITKEDVTNYFSTMAFSPNPGFDRSEIWKYQSELNSKTTLQEPLVRHYVSRFLPVIWLNPNDIVGQIGLKVLFEGTDNIGPAVNGEITFRQLRFGLYQNGNRYINEQADITFTAPTLNLYHTNNSDVSVIYTGSSISNTSAGVFLIFTINPPVTAAKMTTTINMTVPNYISEGISQTATLSLTLEPLI